MEASGHCDEVTQRKIKHLGRRGYGVVGFDSGVLLAEKGLGCVGGV